MRRELTLKDLSDKQKIFLITDIKDFFVGDYYIPNEVLDNLIVNIFKPEKMFHLFQGTILNTDHFDDEEYNLIVKKAFLDYGFELDNFFDRDSWDTIIHYIKYGNNTYLEDQKDNEYEDEIDTELTTKALGMTFNHVIGFDTTKERMSVAKVYYDFLKSGKI
ncbi:MAG: hypothetical protein ACLPWD_00760 [Methanobacterium sp.]